MRPLVIAIASTLLFGFATQAAELPSEIQTELRLGVDAYERGEKRTAFDIFYKLLSTGESMLGPSDGRLVKLYTNMGVVYGDQQQYNYAEDCLKKALHIAEKGYGPNSMQAVPPLIDLGELYVTLKKDAQAKPLMERALAILNKSGDDASLPYAAVAETNLGAMYFAQGNYAFGEPHFKRALELANKSLGPTHRWSTTIGAMYATCLKAGGKAQEAKAVEKAARAKANEAQSPFAVWNKQIKAAEEAMAETRLADAEVALKIATGTLPDIESEPMLKVITLTKYGQLHVLQKKPLLAIEKWQAAQTIADSVMGPDSERALVHAKRLADLEKSQNQYREAEPLYLRLVVNAKKQFGPDSDEYGKALADLAEVYASWAQYPKAVNYYTKLLAFDEKKYGTDSEKLIPVLVALANVSQSNMVYVAEANRSAEDIFKRAAAIATKHYGKNSKELTEVLDGLSGYYQRRYEWEQASKTCAQIIAANEQTFGPTSPQTLKSLERYAEMLRAASLRNQAEIIEARIAKIKGPKKDPDD